MDSAPNKASRSLSHRLHQPQNRDAAFAATVNTPIVLLHETPTALSPLFCIRNPAMASAIRPSPTRTFRPLNSYPAPAQMRWCATLDPACSGRVKRVAQLPADSWLTQVRSFLELPIEDSGWNPHARLSLGYLWCMLREISCIIGIQKAREWIDGVLVYLL